MKIYYDTEFIEDGRTIDLVSIGMVAEDGREYYAVSADLNATRLVNNAWLRKNVLPSLPIVGITLDLNDPAVKPPRQIAAEVRSFVLGDDPETLPDVELWADYGAYDHVALAQLFGTMLDLPEGMPMFTHDIQQEATRLGLSDKDLPKQTAGLHNALADARHVKAVAEFLRSRGGRA